MAESIAGLLERCQLSQYLHKFLAEEVDSLELLKALSEQDLAMLVPIPEHRILIRQELDQSVSAVDPVLAVLYHLHLQRYAAVFHAEEVTDLPTLCSLQDSELQSLIPAEADRLILQAEIATLRATIQDPSFLNELAMKQLIEAEKRKTNEEANKEPKENGTDEMKGEDNRQVGTKVDASSGIQDEKGAAPGHRKFIGQRASEINPSIKVEDIQKNDPHPLP